MSTYKFSPNDIFYNRIKTFPEVSFYIYDQRVIYNNKGVSAGQFVTNVTQMYGYPYTAGGFDINPDKATGGFISLYELNVDRPSDSLIYPFITKDGSLTSFKTISTTAFNSDFSYGQEVSGTYPLIASMSSDRYATDGSRPRISALKTALNSYQNLSYAYAYNSDFGNKATQEMRLISIPSIFYGSSIKKGSVSLKFYITGTLIGELRDSAQNGELKQINNTVGTVAHSSLYAYYKFDDTLADGDWDTSDVLIDSMGSYNATPGGNNIPQGVGKFISASAFSEQANADFFEYNGIPITGSLSAGGGFSVSCWVKKAFDSSAYNDNITVVGCKSSLVAWRLYYQDWNTNKATWYSRDIDGNTRYYTSSVPSTSDNWIHFVGTYQAGTEPKLYVNGEIQSDAGIQASAGATMGDLRDASANLRIGGDFESDDYMSGSLDDLRLYSEVLSPVEIERIYKASSGAGSEILQPSASVAGVVLYDEGFLILTGSWPLSSHTEEYLCPSLPPAPAASQPRWIDFAHTGSDPLIGSPMRSCGKVNLPSSSFSMTFSGTNYVPTLTMLAHASKGQLNHSNNPTYKQYGSVISQTSSVGTTQFEESMRTPIVNVASSSFVSSSADFQKITFIDQIGIYDDNKNLIAVAKLANPIRKREMDDYTFKLKLDF